MRLDDSVGRNLQETIQQSGIRRGSDFGVCCVMTCFQKTKCKEQMPSLLNKLLGTTGRPKHRMSGVNTPAKSQCAHATLVVLCILMGSMSIVMCSLSLRMFNQFRDENEYLNAFIQRHLSNSLFLNKYRFIKDTQVGTFSSFFSPVVDHYRMISGRLSEYGPALAMALLTTHLFATR